MSRWFDNLSDPEVFKRDPQDRTGCLGAICAVSILAAMGFAVFSHNRTYVIACMLPALGVCIFLLGRCGDALSLGNLLRPERAPEAFRARLAFARQVTMSMVGLLIVLMILGPGLRMAWADRAEGHPKSRTASALQPELDSLRTNVDTMAETTKSLHATAVAMEEKVLGMYAEAYAKSSAAEREKSLTSVERESDPEHAVVILRRIVPVERDEARKVRILSNIEQRTSLSLISGEGAARKPRPDADTLPLIDGWIAGRSKK